MKQDWDSVAFVLVLLLFLGWMEWLDYKREASGCVQEEQHADQ
jgi:hypothetical protein